ncbi:putative transposase [Bradyrhizobium sp. SBR1B]|nr:putative transposase [Bradyrhizobium sp. SBR1B]
MTIDRPKQARAADITYLPIGRGFLYLVAILDWASRAVLAWRLPNRMDVSFCVTPLEQALEGCGTREIFNTDRGSQGGFKRSLMLPPKRCITSSDSMIFSALPTAQNGRCPWRWC